MDVVRGWVDLRSWRSAAVALAVVAVVAATWAWACAGAGAKGTPPAATAAVDRQTPASTSAPAASAASQSGAGAGRPAATPAAASARQAAIANLQLSAMLVVRGFQREKLPVGSVQNLTAATDPDHELGAPGAYTSRVNFQDTTLAVQGDPFAVSNGGAVEVFASLHDAQVAKDALAGPDGRPPAGEVDTVTGPVLLRLSTRLQPDQQSSYELAVKDVLRVLARQQAAAQAGSTGTPQAGRAARPNATPTPQAR